MNKKRYNYFHSNLVRREMLSKVCYIKNINNLPKINKIDINFSFPSKTNNKDKFLLCYFYLFLITGGISSKKIFSSRSGKLIGCNLTLKHKFCQNFLEKLFCIDIFKSVGFDGLTTKNLSNVGNFSFTLNSLSIFSEIEEDFETFKDLKNLNICLSLNSKNYNLNSYLLNLYSIIY